MIRPSPELPFVIYYCYSTFYGALPTTYYGSPYYLLDY